jgi:hypothetical protein
MRMETTDDGGVRTILTATVPHWVIAEAGAKLKRADGDLSDQEVRDLITDQLNPVVVYNTPDGENGVGAVREFAERLKTTDD